ncbi:hypothetical protein DFQ04_1691 [Algoriphagus boseongensis]|uniref:Uncharacterized protein n=1 Tax=Algoriphagus boseongensis TaxID=1442587 RepID=A0A4R6T456_9BACT|nr:hypothetical protein [Algoriphagus boseongensis]TDQ17043.1 hypothetical protein DFQ04_1691 [Algoriphagus boseongensis]
MSQFDFPRINFHGSVLFDVATANNGRFDPLQVYDQVLARPIIPPIVNLTPDLIPSVKAAGYTVQPGNYVEISSINTVELFDQWATQVLGKCSLDSEYWALYGLVPLTNPTTDGVQEMLNAGWVQPGYWNYFGDMSVFTEDVQITGIQLPDGNGGVSTYVPGNTSGCPAGFLPLLGANFSFHEDFYAQNPKTSAMFCDVDSIGQTCTQLFFGNAGVYNPNSSTPKTYFSGKPCKATFNWLGISKVINWFADLLMPMSGCAYFYTTIDLTQGTTDPSFQQALNQAAGYSVTHLSVKILVHQVYEVHNPDYSTMPTVPLGNNQTPVHKNPARAAISGSITPFVPGDMTTNTIGRILKNPTSANPTADTSSMDIPTTQAGVKVTLKSPLQLCPAFLKINEAYGMISLDLIGTISEYGIGFLPTLGYGGPTSILPFQSFENYDFGTLNLVFYPDNGSPSITIGQLTHIDNYNMANFIAQGGVFDFALPANVDWSLGSFQLLSGLSPLMVEDDYLIITDQQGTYAEQNQPAGYGYKSDGSGRGPVILRVFRRGIPVSSSSPVTGVYQFPGSTGIISTPFHFYDGVSFVYPVNQAGCTQYVFAITPNQQFPSGPGQGLYFAANNYSITTRVLDAFSRLDPYLEGLLPITWDVIMNEVLKNYETVLPIMYAVLPFTEQNWTEPNTLRYLLGAIDESAWSEPYYMPVTRELSAKQRKLLQKWANDLLNQPNS